MIRRDRSTSSGGGIIVYIKKSILVKSIIIDEFFETISFIFQLPNKFYMSVFSCYRTESTLYCELNFFYHLSSKLIKLLKMSDDVVIVGDLNNVHLLNSGNSLTTFVVLMDLLKL
jgi:ABC-type phosphate transport system ATPase subunit